MRRIGNGMVLAGMATAASLAFNFDSAAPWWAYGIVGAFAFVIGAWKPIL